MIDKNRKMEFDENRDHASLRMMTFIELGHGELTPLTTS